jgi:membrane protease subunit HflK
MTGNGQSRGGGVVEFPDLSRFTRGGAKSLVWIVVVIVLLILAWSSFYTVQPEERGVVLRLGKFSRQTEPGLHFMLPFRIERVYKVAVQRQHKAEFGFRTVQAGIRSRFESSPEEEKSMLTGDLNAAAVEWVVQYRIVDAYQFLFRVRNVEATLKDMSQAVMRLVVGDRSVNNVLTEGRQEIEDEVKLQLQELCDQYENGIRIDQVILQTVNPPDPVKPSFNAVNQAEQEKARLINEAEQEANRVIPRARGEALQTVEQAQGYAVDRVNRSQGEAARFSALYAEYRKAPEVTRKRIYLETLNDVFPKVGRKIVVDDDVEGVLPLLNIGSGVRPPVTGGDG